MQISETYREMEIKLDTEANTLSLNGWGRRLSGPSKPGITIEQVRAIIDGIIAKEAKKPTTKSCIIG